MISLGSTWDQVEINFPVGKLLVSKYPSKKLKEPQTKASFLAAQNAHWQHRDESGKVA
jgi:hypothetical protein